MNLAIFMLSALFSVNAQTVQQAPTKPVKPVTVKPQVSKPSQPQVEVAQASGGVSVGADSRVQVKMGETADNLNPAKAFQDGNSAVAVKIPNPTSTSDILRRLASLEVLAAKLERRVSDLEKKRKAAEAAGGE